MNELQEKIRKTSHGLEIFLKIMRVCCFVGIGFAVVGIITIVFIPETINQSFVIFGVSVKSIFPEGIDINVTLCEMIVGIVQVSILLPCLYWGGNIFHDISISYSPFDKKHTIRMRKIAISLLLMGFIPKIVENVLTEVLLNGMNLVFSSYINIPYILVAVVLFCTSFIFDYGRLLQEQVDQTL